MLLLYAFGVKVLLKTIEGLAALVLLVETGNLLLSASDLFVEGFVFVSHLAFSREECINLVLEFLCSLISALEFLCPHILLTTELFSISATACTSMTRCINLTSHLKLSCVKFGVSFVTKYFLNLC